MSCDSVETRMRIRPRESSLSRPFASASFVIPHRRGERATPWLDRAPNAVPTWLAATLHDERNRSSTRDACDRLSANDTSTTGTHVSRSAIHRSYPLSGSCGCMARFTTPHALRMCRSFTLFEAGILLPATSTELASSDAPVTPRRLPSLPARLRERGFRLREETPAHRSEEASASTRPRPPAYENP